MVNFFRKVEGDLKRMDDVYYVSDSTLEDRILTFANKIEADIIAMLTHGGKEVMHFFEGIVG